eukprot:364841-Chlamydomonas_euryale.AAC.13
MEDGSTMTREDLLCHGRGFTEQSGGEVSKQAVRSPSIPTFLLRHPDASGRHARPLPPTPPRRFRQACPPLTPDAIPEPSRRHPDATPTLLLTVSTNSQPVPSQNSSGPPFLSIVQAILPVCALYKLMAPICIPDLLADGPDFHSLSPPLATQATSTPNVEPLQLMCPPSLPPPCHTSHIHTYCGTPYT